ncbi:MAG: hypothetical protein LHW60_07835 [Candidatus Cloacimonetes bacterium]|jgi:hypothetical protein|nr:hypothetical protein [Candidatus Cloacimonadota bacterium]NLO44288.1 hypothetical protein [Candidatus Cloacimonadota bacterium]
MKKQLLFILSLIFIILLSSCGMRRDNPLDPMGDHGVTIPGDVTGLNASVVTNIYGAYVVRLVWNSAQHVDGYYIYRSLGYNNQYQKVGEMIHVSGETLQDFFHSSQTDETVRPGEYWYRVASYKAYGPNILVGRYSSPVFIRIQP